MKKRSMLLCMPPSCLRDGLAHVLSEDSMGLEMIQIIDAPYPIETVPEILIISFNYTTKQINDIIGSLSAQRQSKSELTVIVLASTIKTSEARQLQVHGVNCILNINSQTKHIQAALALLPHCRIVDQQIIVIDSLTGTRLTPRELQILKLLANGDAAKAVATHLNIKHKTVEAHAYALMKKLDIHNRAELARWYFEHRDSISVTE